MGVTAGNPNTVDQANQAFGADGSWEANNGRRQTKLFAQAFLARANLPTEGKLLDFGCGLGDFLPEVHRAYPRLRLTGVDHSTVAAERGTEKYGAIADFYAADFSNLRDHYDIIHSSNVFEHLDNPYWAAHDLMKFCHRQYIMVPYREGPHLHEMHLTSFHKGSFGAALKDSDVDIESRVFRVPGAWGRTFRQEIGLRLATLLKGDPFSEYRQICFAITKRDAPPSIRGRKPFKPWVL
ncbi:UNVERIFIED_CONTAM: class I SAM-dependent methyltransferase [Methylobacteriaceae bacterium AG10]|nr:class I SAM-dependent methyltransferase [Methylobacteriaceae bacterium AG10]